MSMMMMLKHFSGRVNSFVTPPRSVSRPARSPVGHCFPRPYGRAIPGVTFHVSPVRPRGHQIAYATESGSQSNSPTPGGIVDYVAGQGIYQFLTVLLAALSVTKIFAAPFLGKNLYGIVMTPTVDLGLRVLGSMMIVIVAVSYSLQSAVGANKMHLPTYKRLASALAVALAGICACKTMYVLQGYAMAGAGFYMPSIIQLLPSIAFLKMYGLSTLPEIIPGLIEGIQSLFKPKNLSAALYSFASAGLMVQAVNSIFNPGGMASTMIIEPVDSFSLFLFQVVGLNNFLMSIVCFTLKDGADKGWLGDAPFGMLNVAVCLTAVVKVSRTLYVGAVLPPTATNAVALAPMSWVVSFALLGTLALVSGFNAIRAKKSDPLAKN